MRRLLIALTGGTVLLIGIALLLLPGPGVPFMGAGAAILATEFIWARRAWRRARGTVARVRRKSGFRSWLRARRPNQNKKAPTPPASELGAGPLAP